MPQLLRALRGILVGVPVAIIVAGVSSVPVFLLFGEGRPWLGVVLVGVCAGVVFIPILPIAGFLSKRVRAKTPSFVLLVLAVPLGLPAFLYLLDSADGFAYGNQPLLEPVVWLFFPPFWAGAASFLFIQRRIESRDAGAAA